MTGLIRLVILASVIAPEGEELDITSAVIAEAIEARAAFALDLSLVARSELLAGGLEDRLRACSAEIGCLSDRLSESGIELALIAVADVRDARAISSVELIDGSSRSVIGRNLIEVEARRPALISALEKQTEKLLEAAGHAIGGRIAAEVSPGDAIVALGENVRGGTVFTVPAGEHTLLITREGYAEQSVRVIAERGREKRVEVRLEPEQSILASPWLWTAVGVAVAGATAALIIASSGSSCTCVGLAEPCHGCE